MENKTKPNKNIQEVELSSAEREKITQLLQREPSALELTFLKVLWSDRFSMKHSYKWLQTLPFKTPQVHSAGTIQKITLNDTYECVFSVTPTQSNLNENITDVERSIQKAIHKTIAQGARPVGMLNSMKVGNLKKEKNRSIFKALTEDLSNFLNKTGIPTLAVNLETNPTFDYKGGLSIFCAGISRKKDAKIKPRDLILCIEGTSNKEVASDLKLNQCITESFEQNIAKAAFAIEEGGLAFALQQLVTQSKHGIEVDIRKMQQQTKEAIEIHQALFAESTDRFILVVDKENLEEIQKLGEKWDLTTLEIGKILEAHQLVVNDKGETSISIPAEILTAFKDLPELKYDYQEQNFVEETKSFPIDELPFPKKMPETALRLIKSPNIASKKWLFQQFDSTIGGANLSTNFATDAAVLNIKESEQALVFSANSNVKYSKADPAQGAAISVANAARDIICSGGKPIGAAICFNITQPDDMSVYGQFVETINGIGEACRKLEIPVSNVSFNTLTEDNKPQIPSPTIGIVGLLEDKKQQMTCDFKHKGDMIFLIGETRNEVAASEYLHSIHQIKETQIPYFDLDFERRLQEVTLKLIEKKLIRSAHDVSTGGLFVTLYESSVANQLGFDITTDSELREDVFLFGETQSRILVSVTPNKEAKFIDFMMAMDVPTLMLGHVTRGEMRVDDISFGFINEITAMSEKAIPELLKAK